MQISLADEVTLKRMSRNALTFDYRLLQLFYLLTKSSENISKVRRIASSV